MRAMTSYDENYQDLTIGEDASVDGMVSRTLAIDGGHVTVGGMVAGQLLVSDGVVSVDGSVKTLIVRGGAVDITGRVQSIRIDGGSVTIAVGASVRGRVLDADGHWIAPGGTWLTDENTPRFDAEQVLQGRG